MVDCYYFKSTFVTDLLECKLLHKIVFYFFSKCKIKNNKYVNKSRKSLEKLFSQSSHNYNFLKVFKKTSKFLSVNIHVYIHITHLHTNIRIYVHIYNDLKYHITTDVNNNV